MGREKAKKGPWDGQKGPFFGQSRQKNDSVKFNVASSDLRLKVSKIRDQGQFSPCDDTFSKDSLRNKKT
jgi:hypothetical protein